MGMDVAAEIDVGMNGVAIDDPDDRRVVFVNGSALPVNVVVMRSTQPDDIERLGVIRVVRLNPCRAAVTGLSNEAPARQCVRNSAASRVALRPGPPLLIASRRPEVREPTLLGRPVATDGGWVVHQTNCESRTLNEPSAAATTVPVPTKR
jgi:hypothetical protein